MEDPPPSRTRASSLTILVVDDNEKKVDDIPISSDLKELELAPPVLENSPLEEDDFPEGGRGWLVVLGCFICAALSLGWPCVLPPCFSVETILTLPFSVSWGVFQAYYKQHVFPNTSDTTLSLLSARYKLWSVEGSRFSFSFDSCFGAGHDDDGVRRRQTRRPTVSSTLELHPTPSL